MKPRNTIIALVLVAALGGVLYYLSKHPQASSSATATEKKKLFSFQADQVKEFTIETPDKPAVAVRRSNGQNWEIAAPAGVPSDSSHIQSFVEELPKIEYTPLDSQTPASLTEYGLDQPQKTWKFQLSQGPPVTLLIGKDNPGGYAKYAMLASSPGLFLLDSLDSKDLVEKSLFELRDKRVLPIAVDKAKQLELKFDFKPVPAAEIEKAKKLGLPIKPPKIAITRQPNGNWQMTTPAVRADFGGTNYFVTTVNGGLMKSVEAESPKSLAEYGLDRPQIRLDVAAEDGSLHSLLVGHKRTQKASKKAGEDSSGTTDENQGYYAKNSQWPAVFTINQQLYDQLNQDLENYRNRFLFDFETTNARRLEVQGPTGNLRLDKKGEDWLSGADSQKKSDSTKVSAFLDAIHSLRIQRYPEDDPGHFAEYGLAKPWLKVKITFSEANKEETVLFGRKNNKFYAAREDGPSVYEMSSSEPDSLLSKLKDIS